MHALIRLFRRHNGLVCLLLGVLIAGQGCAAAAPDLSTDTRSSSFGSDAEKIAFLQEYLVLPSPIEATEFHIVYHDNSQGIPGPSDYDIRAVFKVAPGDLALWTAGLQPVDRADGDLSWVEQLLPQEARWQINSEPALFVRPEAHVLVALYAAEGIVVKRVWTE